MAKHACPMCAPNTGWIFGTILDTTQQVPIVCPMCHGEGYDSKPIHRAATEVERQQP